MSSGKQVEVTISSAKDIKNVNWRHGSVKPYAVVWVEARNKCTTRADEEGDTCPTWNEKLVIPLPPEKPVSDDENVLCVDIVHAGREDDAKPLIGSVRLALRDVVHDSGVGVPTVKTLKLKRPSGRPHGKLEVTVTVREPPLYPAPGTNNVRSYDYVAPPPPQQHAYGAPPYATAPPSPYGYGTPYSTAPASGYGYGAAAPAYGQQQQGYGYAAAGTTATSRKGFGGMGTGLAVGAVAGVVGGIALTKGVDAMEDHIAEKAAEKVEDDWFDGYDD